MKSRISALMDGELDSGELDRTLGSLVSEREANETWRMYHLVGDAMRDARPLSGGFAVRVASRLAEEPTVLAPAAGIPARERRRWMVVSAAASVSAIALVGALALVSRPDPQPPAGGPMARAGGPPAQVKASETPRVPLPSAAGDYIFAHQAYAPRVALQGVVPYVRTVDDSAAEGRGR